MSNKGEGAEKILKFFSRRFSQKKEYTGCFLESAKSGGLESGLISNDFSAAIDFFRSFFGLFNRGQISKETAPKIFDKLAEDFVGLNDCFQAISVKLKSHFDGSNIYYVLDQVYLESSALFEEKDVEDNYSSLTELYKSVPASEQVESISPSLSKRVMDFGPPDEEGKRHRIKMIFELGKEQGLGQCYQSELTECNFQPEALCLAAEIIRQEESIAETLQIRSQIQALRGDLLQVKSLLDSHPLRVEKLKGCLSIMLRNFATFIETFSMFRRNYREPRWDFWKRLLFFLNHRRLAGVTVNLVEHFVKNLEETYKIVKLLNEDPNKIPIYEEALDTQADIILEVVLVIEVCLDNLAKLCVAEVDSAINKALSDNPPRREELAGYIRNIVENLPHNKRESTTPRIWPKGANDE